MAAHKEIAVGIIFKMVSRREIKEKHEFSVLDSFRRHQKDQGNLLTISERPDPPDAIVDINGKRTWIEISDAFYSQEIAISVTSFAADDVPHRPSVGGLVDDPDATTLCAVESVIRQKLTKQTMKELAKNMGPGILLVGLYGPFFDIDETANNLSKEVKNEIAQQNIFDSIYLYENGSSNGHIYKVIK